MRHHLALVAALATVAGFIIVPQAAFSQDFDIHIGRPGGPRPDGPPPGYAVPPDYDDEDAPPPPRRARGCDPDDAEDEARDMGLHRAHVVDVTPRQVVVEGFGRHGPDRMYFANARGCPFIGR
jgi:hypothetical protein